MSGAGVGETLNAAFVCVCVGGSALLASDPPSEVAGWPCMKHLRGEPSDLYVPDLDLHVTYKLRGPPLRKADPGPAWQPLLGGQRTLAIKQHSCTARFHCYDHEVSLVHEIFTYWQ